MENKTTYPTFNPTFFRTYSCYKDDNSGKESWDDVVNRCVKGLTDMGQLSDSESRDLEYMMRQMKVLPSGRWLWIGGVDWILHPPNFPGAYNCSSTNVDNLKTFGYMADLAMCGCGIGASLEFKYVNQLPVVRNMINVKTVVEVGSYEPHNRLEHSKLKITRVSEGNFEGTTGDVDVGVSLSPLDTEVTVVLEVGDSRKGWVDAYQSLIELAFEDFGNCDEPCQITVLLDLGSVRGGGERLKGFGGLSNPGQLSRMFTRVARHLSKAVGRKLKPIECGLIVDEAMLEIEMGGIRRSAGILQFSEGDEESKQSKMNLWQVDEQGNWKIDPERDALRMANHTIVYHRKPSLDEVIKSITEQFQSGEGAIEWAGEAVKRANADILRTDKDNDDFIALYNDTAGDSGAIAYFLTCRAARYGILLDQTEADYRAGIYKLNPCFTGDMRLLTEHGYQSFESLSQLDRVNIVNSNGEVTVGKVVHSGKKFVVKMVIGNEAITCTADHRFLVDGIELEAEHCQGKRLTPFLKAPEHQHRQIFFGICQAIGNKLSHSDVIVSIDPRDGEIAKFLDTNKTTTWSGYRDIIISNLFPELERRGWDFSKFCERSLPHDYNLFSLSVKAAFLNGFFSPLAFIRDSKLWLPVHNPHNLSTIQDSLKTSFGIISQIFSGDFIASESNNGTYNKERKICLVIDDFYSLVSFFNNIGLCLSYKRDKLAKLIYNVSPVVTEVVGLPQPQDVYDFTEPDTHWGVVEGFIAHNCGEILLNNNFCNLSDVHLKNLDPFDIPDQQKAFRTAVLSVAPLLKHQFTYQRYQQSRIDDPIVGVSITGAFDFFVNLFGIDYLLWWLDGRPDNLDFPNNELAAADVDKVFANLKLHNVGITRNSCSNRLDIFYNTVERFYFDMWRQAVKDKLAEYCDRHNLKSPNRYTTIQPSGTKSLLTGSSPGWHPPFAAYWIRRIKFVKNDPVAKACIDYGYKVVPGQNDTDSDGNLLTDIDHPNCSEWLVEIPCAASWNVDTTLLPRSLSFPATALFDFYMNAQRFYTTHNTSGTIPFSEEEILPLAKRIHKAIDNDEGYISCALLPRFDAPFPRLPFEPISEAHYNNEWHDIKQRRVSDDFDALLQQHLAIAGFAEAHKFEESPSACSSGKCEI